MKYFILVFSVPLFIENSSGLERLKNESYKSISDKGPNIVGQPDRSKQPVPGEWTKFGWGHDYDPRLAGCEMSNDQSSVICPDGSVFKKDAAVNQIARDILEKGSGNPKTDRIKKTGASGQ